MPTLGDGTSVGFIYARGGESLLLPLTGVETLEWGRSRNAISKATATITVPAATADCVRALGRLEPWAHELVIFRNGRRVWEGPVRDIQFTPTDVTIDAGDVWSWAKRRRIHSARDTTGSPLLISEEGRNTVVQAYAHGDPNVLPHLDVRTGPGEVTLARKLAANSGYYDADMDALTKQGLNFTVLNRAIILWPDPVLLGRTETLIPEQHTTAPVTVIVSGDDLATEATAVGDNGMAATADAGDTYYSPVERLITATGTVDATGLYGVAAAAVAELYPAPVKLVVPQDAALMCDAPFPLEVLVPGVLVPVRSEATPRKVQAVMVLQDVKVTQTPDGEQVKITLAPVSATAVEEG